MFKSLNLKPSYYTDEGNIAQEFYIPVLSQSVQYDRISGYFSAKALASYAKGIQGLIENGGKMRLIISHDLSEEDYRLIEKGYALRKEIQEQFLERLNDSLTLDEQINYSNLAHLIAEGYVDIKIGFTHHGIFHTKYGICIDATGDIIYFTGSNNETEAAIYRNYESFDVSASWKCSEFDLEKPKGAITRFNSLWDGMKNHFVYVQSFNDIVRKKIITYDKGKIILNQDMLLHDTLVLSYENERLVIHDNLTSYKIKGTEPFITQKLFPYLEDEYPNFSSSLTHLDIQNIVKIIEKFSKRKGFNFVVSDEVKEFISQKSYFIQERADYAYNLKYYEKSIAPQILERFEKFKVITEKFFERPLRDVQLWCAFYMYEMQKSSNFSVPGAGKTAMKYATFAYLNSPEVDKVDRLVVFGPKNSFMAWTNEFKANFGENKSLKVVDVQKTKYTSTEFLLACGDANLILVNYEAVPKFQDALKRLINNRTMLVLDEVHRIKGITSSRALAVKEVCKKAIYKYALTGTPIPNTYEDIYNLLNILYDEEYRLYFNFRKDELKKPSPLLVERINNALYPFFWRTTKEQLDVPKSNEDELCHVVANEDEQEIINMLYRKFGRSAFELYIRLMQASSNPKLLLNTIDYVEMYGEDASDENNPWNQVDDDLVKFTEEEIQLIQQVPKSSKYYAAIDLATDLHLEGKQSIIWCMFVDTIQSVSEDLHLKGLRVATIFGSTPQKERDFLINKFLNNEIDVLVTNPHTLGESVSLHHTCHDAIYLEYSFNLTHMLQSKDRIHRLGLADDQYTQYYFFMMNGQEGQRNTIDERIYNRLKEKEEIMINAIERGVLEPDPTVNLDEILDLLGD